MVLRAADTFVCRRRDFRFWGECFKVSQCVCDKYVWWARERITRYLIAKYK